MSERPSNEQVMISDNATSTNADSSAAWNVVDILTDAVALSTFSSMKAGFDLANSKPLQQYVRQFDICKPNTIYDVLAGSTLPGTIRCEQKEVSKTQKKFHQSK
ncbi:MAG: hypothetical protein K2X77_09140 [Candidatus Obscuribacterales bacterium]|nr:hypothetical protein [Candidatus Obscuribacterales bacterium]